MRHAEIVQSPQPVVYASGTEAYPATPRQSRMARAITLFAYAGAGWLGLVGALYLLTAAI